MSEATITPDRLIEDLNEALEWVYDKQATIAFTSFATPEEIEGSPPAEGVITINSEQLGVPGAAAIQHPTPERNYLQALLDAINWTRNLNAEN